MKCHDENMFLQELLYTPPDGIAASPPGVGRGPILNTTIHPSNSAIKKYEYSFWQEDGKGSLVTPLTRKAKVYEKTTIQGLTSNPNIWQASANEAVEDAISRMQFPTVNASFRGVSTSGLQWEGWYRDGKIQTIYVTF